MIRRPLGKGIAVLAVVVLLLGMAAPAFAQDAGAKFWRGLANTGLGWWLIPKTIWETSQNENPLYGLTVGTLQGAGMAILRTAAGAVEVVTFPFPFPKDDYAPLVDPEYPWSEEEVATQ